MQQVIYVDVLIFLNTIITLLLLLQAAEISNVQPTVSRLIVGALLGGAYSLVILAPEMNIIGITVTRIAMSVSLVCIVFRIRSAKKFIRCFAAFFGSGFLLAGIIWASDSFFKSSFITVNNSFFYCEIGTSTLICTSAVAFLIIRFIKKAVYSKDITENYYNVDIFFNGNRLTVNALCDTGNTVNDVYSGAGVIILTRSEAIKLVGEKNAACFDSDYLELAAETLLKIRLLPVSSLENESLLPCFTADKAVIYNDKKTKILANPSIAVTSDNLGNDSYSALISESAVS